MTIIDLAEKRAPVWYTIHIGHHWNGRLEVIVEDVSADPRSQASVLYALRKFLEHAEAAR